MNDKELIQKAKDLVNPKKLSEEAISGEVGSVLVTDKGNIYSGVSIHAACGVGFCAEHTAIGNMLTNNESRIEKIVAFGDERVLSPCGRCRELMYQVNPENKNTDVILGENKTMKLKDLLPEHWQENYTNPPKN
jgi:cytidine deaminase